MDDSPFLIFCLQKNFQIIPFLNKTFHRCYMSNIHKYLNLPMKPTLFNINLINASSPLKMSRTLTKQKKNTDYNHQSTQLTKRQIHIKILFCWSRYKKDIQFLLTTPSLISIIIVNIHPKI